MRTHIATLALIAAAFAPAMAGAQSTVKLAARSDSKLTIEGNSNVHSWECSASRLDASVVMDSSVMKLAAVDYTKLLKSVDVKIAVTELHCGHGGMDKNMYKALKSDQAPSIRYTMTSYDSSPNDANSYNVKTVGTLAVAGQTNTVKGDVIVTRSADGTIRAQGSVPMLMTDFGIQPPTAMFGALRTDNKVVVRFDLYVAPTTTVATTAAP